jgi:hypothetical protein
VREIRMLRLTRRELETGLHGTAPVLDPTLGGLGAAMPPGYPVFQKSLILIEKANRFGYRCI